MLSAGPVCSCARSLCAIAHETAGAARTRSSLRPLIGEGERYANLGRNAPRDREGVLSTPSPRSRGERVGVRGSLHTLDSWRQPLTRRYAPTSPREERGEVTLQAQFVFATLGGAAVVTNDVASSIARPNGVGMVMRNGTRTRVPAIGTKAISIRRSVARYLITGRSGI